MTSDGEPFDEKEHAFPTMDVDRREVLVGGIIAPALLNSAAAAEAQPASTAAGRAAEQPRSMPIRATVNGERRTANIDTRTSLLDLLREKWDLTGAKKGCNHGQCGACTVHVDGRQVVSCLTQAAKIDGAQVVTIEGLSPIDGALHPMQQAFVDNDALQCGYCTPGQIMAAVAMVREGNATSPERIREYMSGNLCRCGAYVGIVAAIQAAAAATRSADAGSAPSQVPVTSAAPTQRSS